MWSNFQARRTAPFTHPPGQRPRILSEGFVVGSGAGWRLQRVIVLITEYGLFLTPWLKRRPLNSDFVALAQEAARNSANVRLEEEDLGIDLEEEEGEEGKSKRRGPKQPGQSRVNGKRAKRRKIEQQNAGRGPSSGAYAQVLSRGTAIELKGQSLGRERLDELGNAVERQKFYTALELVRDKGFEHTQWDGKTPYPIIDRLRRIVTVLAGQPEGNYADDLMKAHDAMKTDGTKAGLGKGALEGGHLRGRFPAYNCGTTMRMGSPRPIVMRPKDKVLSYIDCLDGQVPKLCPFAIGSLGLPENFKNVSVFAAVAFNFGGNIGTFKHRDALNWAFGRTFDPTRSAQLILWELKLVINFSHTATVLTPSAIVTNSNTAVAEGDDRGSFTQYTAGPIFRWVNNGCRTEKEFEEDPGSGVEYAAGRSPEVKVRGWLGQGNEAKPRWLATALQTSTRLAQPLSPISRSSPDKANESEEESQAPSPPDVSFHSFEQSGDGLLPAQSLLPLSIAASHVGPTPVADSTQPKEF
ncbi:hypothetical protein BT96DRAFT_944950 [Gymnopus androsaceus JB14]|uniref:Uncharacterized protein n=1 Tax=Gymnopus androsaceus JB14 TaxID=1447944 RepID=A0A6A4H4J0_9AGAR|nr:hypothetical protein BT96DRAFT_944950 [Gymnopus androsaceus JB14]